MGIKFCGSTAGLCHQSGSQCRLWSFFGRTLPLLPLKICRKGMGQLPLCAVVCVLDTGFGISKRTFPLHERLSLRPISSRDSCKRPAMLWACQARPCLTSKPRLMDDEYGVAVLG